MNDFDAGFRVGVEKAPSYKENQELRDEIEWLRALLREAFDGLDDYWITTPEGVSWVLRVSEALGDD